MADASINGEIVSYLDGYIRALTAVEGIHNSSLSAVFFQKINQKNVQGELERIYREFAAQMSSSSERYEFDNVVEVSSRELESLLSHVVLAAPFARSDMSDFPELAETRSKVVFHIVEIVHIARDGDGGKKNYRAKMTWFRKDSIYEGNILIFPCAGGAIFIKLVKKLGWGSEKKIKGDGV